MNKLFQVGITGGIGAGKSTICKIFQSLGTPVYNADEQAKRLMNSNHLLIEQIKKLFGEKAYKNGNLDSTYISSRVFHNQEQLNQLNALVHPAVARGYHHWLEKHKNEPYVIKEAALLLETGSADGFDKIIVVVANKKIRIKRVLNRDSHRDEAQITAIISNQIKAKEAIAKADYVIYNDGSEMVLPKIIELHQQLISSTRNV